MRRGGPGRDRGDAWGGRGGGGRQGPPQVQGGDWGPGPEQMMGGPGDRMGPLDNLALPPPPLSPAGAPPWPPQQGEGEGERPGVRAHLGTQDYSQHFVDTKKRPQNFIMDEDGADRYEHHPRQKRLYEAKTAQVEAHLTPAYALKADLKRLKLSPEVFGTRFDVILIDPPWEEYVRRAPGFVPAGSEAWSWKEIQDLAIEDVADTPSFVFLWCGSEEGLDAGRHCLEKWGFRRVEVVCWVKTNKDPDRKYTIPQNQNDSLLVHTVEHCLVGMRGKLNRTRDAAFVHANCDTDVIVGEEPPLGSTRKPEELYGTIERFCNGRRRLELFGEDHNIRDGWVTVGKAISRSNFKPLVYREHFKDKNGVPYNDHRGDCPPPGASVLVPSTDEIEELREKSPEPRGGGPPPRGPPRR